MTKYQPLEEFKESLPPKPKNCAFIDGQNLYLGTLDGGWKFDYKKLRTYLAEKYNVIEAHYFLGFVSNQEQDLYVSLQKAGFILDFREHSSALLGKKKGNVDCDIVFAIMKKIIEEEEFDKILIVSGDGDYFKLVDYLIKKGKVEKMLFPNQNFASSLYDKFGSEFYDFLEKPDIRNKISFTRNEKGS
jgi:uncharacterized LabA/DUF88 family protein